MIRITVSSGFHYIGAEGNVPNKSRRISEGCSPITNRRKPQSLGWAENLLVLRS